MRFFPAVLGTLLMSLPVVARAAPAVSETERAAARQLFQEGDALQRDQKYAEALDKFERAEKVFPAPTNELRIAQCQAMVGQLVESAETYRAVTRTELPPNAPAAFHQAVEQAKAELLQVEPRVPRVKIDVTPANVAALDVKLDGQRINAALIGEPLPLDPGTHTIIVSAPGYSSDEKSVTVKERESKTLAFAIAPAAGVAAPPPYNANEGKEPPPPPPPMKDETSESASRRRARQSILLGLRLGLDFPAGNFASGTKISNYAGAGLAGGLEGGIRAWDHWYFGLFVQGAGYAQGSDPANGLGTLAGSNASGTTTSTFGGIDVAYITNAHGVGAIFDLGLAYRSVRQETKISGVDASRSLDSTTTYGGGELVVGGGAFIKASSWLRIVPRLSLGMGSFNTASQSCSQGSAGAPAGMSCPSSPTTSIDSSNQAAHVFAFLGVSGFYDIALK